MAKKPAVKKRVVKKKSVKTAKPVHPLMVDHHEWDREKVIDVVCDELATSSRGLGMIITIARKDHGDFPSYSTIMKWLDEEEALSERYARAREAQADYMADETIEIADDATNDYMEREDDDGNVAGYRFMGEHVQRSKLRVDTRKWLAAKLRPKKYGEKVQVSGDEGGAPIKTETTFVVQPVKPRADD